MPRMRLFGRDPRQHIGEMRRLPVYLWYFVKVALTFRRPLEFIRAYLAQRSPRGDVVETRGGLRILLSGHPHDAITVFVVFIRGDYGRIAPGSVVADVGANIGVFALWAAHCGAKRVLAFEPSASTFALLQRNVEENGLQDVIEAHRAAVYGVDGAQVPFARNGSMYSAIGDDSDGESDLVPTVTLNTIVRRAGGRVDLLKLDCEGAEYAAIEAADLGGVGEVKLEYHRGRADQLIAWFEDRSFRVAMWRPANEELGNLWAIRTSSSR